MVAFSVRRAAVSMAAAISAAAGGASATWSIVICDTRTGEVAVASATCLTSFDLQANTPVLLVGIGGATAQSFVDSTGTNRTFIRDGFYNGTSPDDILVGLSVFDSSHQNKQYGIVDVHGRAATFSGTGAGIWKGGTIGTHGDLVYAVQGNVLWGPEVVDHAVQAIIDTPGDVPAKLMASMIAARVEGGDGRCSCNQANPTGCSTLPPSFKSAHIAYMLIGRAGDTDASNGNYRFTGFSNAATVGDFTGDGKPDVLTAGSSGISVSPNITEPGQMPRLGTAILSPLGYTPRDVIAADFNADGVKDLAVTNNAGDAVSVLIGSGNGTFSAPAIYAVGDAPGTVAAADLNGDGRLDMVVANQGSDTCSIFTGNGDGTFAAPSTMAAGDGSGYVALIDIDADGDSDILAGNVNARSLSIHLNSGAGVFTLSRTLSFTQYVVSADGGDINADGRPDLLITNNSEATTKVLLQNADGSFTTSTLPNGGPSTNCFLRDLDGDGDLDAITAQRTTSRMNVFRGNGDGTFSAVESSPIGFSPQSMSLADMDGDGDLDPFLRIATGLGCIMLNRGNGEFSDVSGLAGGDYFMSFNVANQSASNADPVDQLVDLYGAWRASLVGMPDAVLSLASFADPVIHADGESTVLNIRAGDWQLADVNLAGAQVTATIFGDSVVTAGTATINGDGSASIPVSAGSVCGTAVVELTIEGIGRKVVLMPRVALTVSDPSDFDRSGFVDTDDFTSFVTAFELGDESADFDKTGFVDTDDFTAFVLRFQDPC
ncbi:MAG TPA: FG-GAP-like repeat-containing protein [Phycisphaerales bacterium]|nr:FG-GAP-like repeat-containing protein [Phycisphaerales bacterium]